MLEISSVVIGAIFIVACCRSHSCQTCTHEMSRTGGMHVDVGSQLPKVWLSGRITRKLPCAVHIHLAALAVPQRQKVEVRSSTHYLALELSSIYVPITGLAGHLHFAIPPLFASARDSRPGHSPKWQPMRTCTARYVYKMLSQEELAILTAGTARNERCISSRYRKQQLPVHAASMTDT